MSQCHGSGETLGPGIGRFDGMHSCQGAKSRAIRQVFGGHQTGESTGNPLGRGSFRSGISEQTCLRRLLEETPFHWSSASSSCPHGYKRSIGRRQRRQYP